MTPFMRCAALLWVSLSSGAILANCTEPAATPAGAIKSSPKSILSSSTPASGSTVKAPVDELMLHFDPPARLDEVTVTGSGGTMPMMVHAAGETDHYSLPVSGLGAGSYTVNWRATAQGTQYRGSFSFTVTG